jgi:succinyl-diaminopimelate desuccinylase
VSRASGGVDLLALTAELVDIPSISHHEEALASFVFDRLSSAPWLTVSRVGSNVVARTSLGRPSRVVLAGHVDTVPANGNLGARVEGDVLWGLGSADMKSGCAVLLALAVAVDAPLVDVTYVFYECEEVSREHNGLARLFRESPELLACDVAVLCEPTGAVIEAGCQGVLRVDVTLAGARAHTARPWMGRNAIHRLSAVLERVQAFPERRPVLDGCEFREALQAVFVSGGVAGNVVPDQAVVRLSHRFAPDRTASEAFEAVRALLGDALELDGRADGDGIASGGGGDGGGSAGDAVASGRGAGEGGVVVGAGRLDARQPGVGRHPQGEGDGAEEQDGAGGAGRSGARSGAGEGGGSGAAGGSGARSGGDGAGGDSISVVDSSPPAPPSLDHPLLQRLAASVGQPPRANLGWTDVAFFAEQGIPATNFGPGDPTVAHTAGECVHRSEIESVYAALHALLTT